MGVFLRLFMALALLGALLGAGPAAAAEWTLPPETDHAEALLAPPPPVPEDWITVHGVYARVHAPASHARVAQRLANHAARSVPAIAEQLALPAGRTMTVYLADSDATFRALQPGAVPSWADATAWPHRSLIFLRDGQTRGGTAKPLEQVFDHEITHVLLGQAFGPRPVPT